MDSSKIREIRETQPKWKNNGRADGAMHSVINPGPENAPYDKARHERMNLRSPNYGNHFFTHGSKPPRQVCADCQQYIEWCICYA